MRVCVREREREGTGQGGWREYREQRERNIPIYWLPEEIAVIADIYLSRNLSFFSSLNCWTTKWNKPMSSILVWTAGWFWDMATTTEITQKRSSTWSSSSGKHFSKIRFTRIKTTTLPSLSSRRPSFSHLSVSSPFIGVALRLWLYCAENDRIKQYQSYN